MSDCKITSLPKEIIATILEYDVITIEDVINFRCVCKQFRYAAATYNKFLDKKLFQRWPYAKKHYESLEKRENINFITTGINFAKDFRNYLSQILFYDYYYNNRSNQNYFDDPIDNVFEFDDVMDFSGNIDKYVKRLKTIPFLRRCIYDCTRGAHIAPINVLKYMFYIEEIKCWLLQFPQGIDRKLIERDCNIKRLHYLKLSSIGNDLDTYIKKPEEDQLLEETCTFVAKYIQVQKNVCNIQCTYTNVSASLDTIAQEVLNRLREKHPNHSIYSTSEETVSSWKTKNIGDNHWNETESTQIMDTLQEYIFDTFNFRPCTSPLDERRRISQHNDSMEYLSVDIKFLCRDSIKYSSVDIKSLCIDYVLQNKYGQGIIVYTIFHSVARRLGLRCDVINLSYFAEAEDGVNRFGIFWKPKFVSNNLENARCFTIKYLEYPNFFSDGLPLQYKLYTVPIAITTEEMLETARDIVRMFITKHDITEFNLVRMKCNI